MSLLYDIIIAPIESIVEMVFTFSYVEFSKFGVAGAIIAVSLAINFLALPLYNIADELQLRERNIQNKMADRLKKIKAAFSGNERFMITQTYYRMNNYNPLYALRSSLSILIEIPFFIAAYHFLSHCPALENQSIWILKDLSAPDGLISIPLYRGGCNVNLLPILMTLINCISSFVYTKGAPIREKIQVYGLAIVFLAILYNSPSGLVFYWILNNLFSLLKNIVQKMKHPGKILHVAISLILIFACVYLATNFPNANFKRKLVVYFASVIIILIPFFIKFAEKIFEKKSKLENKPNFVLFISSTIVLWVLTGLLLPSNVIATSPTEFSFLGSTKNPLTYIKTSSIFFFGLFVFWPFCIYKMFGNKTRKWMDVIFFVLSVSAFLNVFLFKYEYGTMSILFRLDNNSVLQDYGFFYSCVPIISLIVVSVVLLLSLKFKKEKIVSAVMIAMILAISSVAIVNMNKIKKSYDEFSKISKKDVVESTEIKPVFNLSKEKQNIIVLFFDRMMPSFLPYIIEQFPNLEQDFSGFTLYPNCVSFSSHTITSTPSMLAGYDYTPVELNKRADEKLVDKHNEALSVIPKLLGSVGFDVVMSNPPLLNYTSAVDEKTFSDFDNVKLVDLKKSMYVDNYKLSHQEDFGSSIPVDNRIKKMIKSFSLFQIFYPPVRVIYYGDGSYYVLESTMFKESGTFLDNYASLYYLPELTAFDNENSEYVFFGCETTHEYTSLLAPDYRPGVITGSSEIASTGNYKYKTRVGDETDFDAYHVTVATMLQTAKYLNYLKENNVYDNTKIIIVSDHGRRIHTPAFGDQMDDGMAKAFFNATFMVKDFNSDGNLKTDQSFMTNAETVNYVLKDLPLEKKNPFNGKELKSVDDFETFDLYGVAGTEWSESQLINKNQFTLLPQNGWQVKENIFDDNNWIRLDRVGK